MIPDDTKLYFMSAAALEGLSDAPAGGLVPVITWQEGVSQFHVRDTFDRELRASGRMLIELEDRAEVLCPGSASAAQPDVGAARFVADFPEGPVKAALGGLSPLRCLLPVGAGPFTPRDFVAAG